MGQDLMKICQLVGWGVFRVQTIISIKQLILHFMDPYADSLDTELKISAFPGSVLKDKKVTTEDLEITPDNLRNKFISSLQKLTQISTQEKGIKQIKQTVQSFRNEDCLRIYLSVLKGLKKKPSNSSTMEAQLVVIGYLARMYGERLVDSADKPPSLLKTTFKVVELVHTYFIDNNQGVSESAAKTLIDIQKHVLKNQAVQHQISLIFTPLLTMLSAGIERSSQFSAIFCICKLVEFWKSSGTPQLIKRVQSDLLLTFLKLHNQFNELLHVSGITFMEPKINQFVNKLLGILQESQNQPMMYQSKILVLKVLEQMAGLLKNSPLLNLIKPLQVLSELQKIVKSRIIPIQSAGNSTYKAWRILLDLDSSDIVERPRTSPIGSLKEMRQRRKEEKSREKSDEKRKETRSKLQEQLNVIGKDLQESLKERWGSSKGKQYMKKGTGIGGGQTGKFISQGDNKNKSYQDQIKELRRIIESEPKSPKKNEKSVSPENDVRGKDSKIRIENLSRELKQPSSQNNKQNEFTLQNNYSDQSLSFDISKSHQNVLPQFNTKNKVPPGEGLSQLRDLQSKRLESERNESQAFSDMSSNLDGILDSGDFGNQSEMELADSNLNQQIEMQVKNLAHKREDSLKNTAQKFMKKSKTDMSVSNSELEREMEESIKFELSKLRESESKQRPIPHQKFERHPEPSRFDTLKDIGNYDESLEEEVVSDYEVSYEPVYVPRKQERREETGVKQPRKVAGDWERRPVQEPERKPVVKQISMSKQIELEIKPQIKTETVSQINIQSNYKNTRGMNQVQEDSEYSQTNIKNYQNLIQRPPTEGFSRHPEESMLSRAPSRLTEQQKPTDEGLLDSWKQILYLAQNLQIQQAYQRVFELDDIIYFLRLLITTGPCFQKMTASTAKRVMGKLTQIHSSNFFQILVVGMLGQAADLNIVAKSYNIQEMNSVQKYLYDLSGRSTGKLSYSTAMLYNKIDKQLKE